MVYDLEFSNARTWMLLVVNVMITFDDLLSEC